MSAHAVELSPLGPRRYEIQEVSTGKYGLAVFNSLGQWEISPNMEPHQKEILKRIREIENPEEAVEPKPEPQAKPRKGKKGQEK